MWRSAPALHAPVLRFDLLHIDGYHDRYHCESDLRHGLRMALKGAWVIVDDTDLASIREFYDETIDKGHLIAAQPPGWEEYPRHAVARAP